MADESKGREFKIAAAAAVFAFLPIKTLMRLAGRDISANYKERKTLGGFRYPDLIRAKLWRPDSG